MNLLQLVQRFSARTGLPRSVSAALSSDPQVVQIVELANEVLEDVVDRGAWTDLTREAVFATVSGEDQGPVKALAPDGFNRILRETIFNRTLNVQLTGSLTPQQWQAAKSLATTGPSHTFRIQAGRLYLFPGAEAGHTCAFEYASDLCLFNPTTGTYKSRFDRDDDEFLLSDKVLMAGLRWKWKSEKGLDYAEEFQRYEELVTNAKGRDGVPQTLRMDGCPANVGPSLLIPAMNWKLP